MPQESWSKRIVLGPEDDVVARAALLILETISGCTDPMEWRLDEHRYVDAGQTARHLSQLPKPLVCEAVCTGAVCSIKCGDPEQDPRWKWWSDLGREPDATALGPNVLEQIHRTGNRSVLVAGAVQSIVLTDTQVAELARDYVMLGNHTTTAFLGARMDSTLDVAAVLSYWPSESSTRVSDV